MAFQPPEFVRPPTYDFIPRSIDGFFNAYQTAKQSSRADQTLAMQQQESKAQLAASQASLASSNLQQRLALGGLDPVTVTPQDWTNAIQPAPAMVPEGKHASILRGLLDLQQKNIQTAQKEKEATLLKTQNEAANTGSEAAARNYGLEIYKKLGGQQGGGPPTVSIGGQPHFVDFDPKSGKIDFKATTDPSISGEQDLRKEYTSGTSAFRDLNESYGKVIKSANDTNPESRAQNDLSLLFGFIRMQHPNALVREGQILTAEEARSIGQDVASAYNKVLQSGQPLTDKQRGGFLSAAKNLYQSQLPGLKQQQDFFTGIAKNRGLNPANIVQKYDSPDTAPSYKSADEVKAAVRAGSLTLDEGKSIVRTQFGYK